MKVLVFGPSGSGKTYVSHTLQKKGINAYDADDIEDLFAWYDRSGKEVPPPQSADVAMKNQYAFLWSKKMLARFLEQFSEIYIFGGSGNVTDMFDLFDSVYFLQVEPGLQKERLSSTSRKNPLMDSNDEGIVIWGGWFEEFAKKRHIPFIDASQTPEQIFACISQ